MIAVQHLQHFLLWSVLLLRGHGVYSAVVVEPQSCICPEQSYTCRAYDITGMSWNSEALNERIPYNRDDPLSKDNITREGVQVLFSEDGTNHSSQLFLTPLHRLSGEIFTCIAFSGSGSGNASVTACIIGPASAPTDLSVVWDPPSAVVSFQSPVYGGECVDHYIVTATSEEGNVSCVSVHNFSYSCNIPDGSNVNEYNFTAYPITPGINGVIYKGRESSECCLAFPEVVSVFEEGCGLIYRIKVHWEKIDHEESVNTTISWHGVNSSEERASSEDSHLLTLDYSESGRLEISVTFSSPVCRKTTVTHYLVEEILRNVSLNSTTLVIESRDCIVSRENYRIVVTSTDTPSTELVNVSFSPTIEHDVGDVVRPNTQYTIRVQLVETTSGTTINEITTTIMYTSPTATPSEPDGDVAIIVAVGIGGAVGLLAIAAGAVALAVWLVKRNKFNMPSLVRVAFKRREEETKILSLQSQASVGSRYEAPATPAPGLPETEDTKTDSVGPLYDDLNTLSRKKEEAPAAEHMYHELEGPPPADDSEPQTQETQETLATGIPLYSVIDKSKKKTNRASKPSASASNATQPATDTPLYSVVDKSKKKKNRAASASISAAV